MSYHDKKYDSKSEYVDSSSYVSTSGKKYSIDIIKGSGFPIKRLPSFGFGPSWVGRHDVRIVDAEKDKEIIGSYTRTSPFIFTGKLCGKKLIEQHEANEKRNKALGRGGPTF